MARKPKIVDDDMFASTTPQEPADPNANADLDEGRILSSGVGLKQGELAAIDNLAEQYGTTRNALLHIAIRYFIVKVRSGEIDPGDFLETPKQPKKRAIMPK